MRCVERDKAGEHVNTDRVLDVRAVGSEAGREAAHGVRDDENLAHYACRHCDHMKAVNRPWWDFASEAGTGFH